MIARSVILKPFLAVAESDGFIYVGVSTAYRICLGKRESVILLALRLLRGGLPSDRLSRMRELKTHGLTSKNIARVEQLIARLRELALLVDDSIKLTDPSSRTLSFLSLESNHPDKALRRLRRSKVMIWGCGGLGGTIAPLLLGAGVRNLVLVDPDRIELSNISRTPAFRLEHIGRTKVEVIAEHLRRQDPSAVLSAYPLRLNADNIGRLSISEKADLIIITADDGDGSFAMRHGKDLYKIGVPHCFGGYWERTALIGPFIIPGVTGCFNCGFRSHKMSTVLHPPFLHPSLGAVNSLVAGFLVLETVRFLLEGASILVGRRTELDIRSLQSTQITFSRDRRCPVCHLDRAEGASRREQA